MSVCPTPPDSYVEALTVTVAMFFTCEQVKNIATVTVKASTYESGGVGHTDIYGL